MDFPHQQLISEFGESTIKDRYNFLFARDSGRTVTHVASRTRHHLDRKISNASFWRVPACARVEIVNNYGP